MNDDQWWLLLLSSWAVLWFLLKHWLLELWRCITVLTIGIYWYCILIIIIYHYHHSYYHWLLLFVILHSILTYVHSITLWHVIIIMPHFIIFKCFQLEAHTYTLLQWNIRLFNITLLPCYILAFLPSPFLSSKSPETCCCNRWRQFCLPYILVNQNLTFNIFNT